ncbi:LysR family transcriptional regulator [Leminorella grimontii]|uniref:LysR family transcriptional regulator n=1 Tax=Leminorella grimontii TaxID=82981 RepID=A0AAV5N0Z0_9GAMM|nr:LysR family transcriptional regulator [Leminorella grimontii]KFC93522.1 LysR family transcriptional regulator [Leminorella grimontii ATCC 33999 = DSM 5078]GKX55785.1 LysR family transcriptional regulator [Leminorella grimontii]VFS55187.1 Cyn operon transcriptional activator [Leminorella grimontii]
MTTTIKRASWAGGWATLRDLEIVQTVIDAGSVTGAAERLGISQPAVSRTLNQIETRCGRPLFLREGNRLSPTADALTLYQEIGIIAESFSRLTQFQQRQRRAPLRILAPSTLAHGFVNRITAEFMQAYPEITVYLEIVRSEQIPAMMAQGQADVAIADAVAYNDNYSLSQTPVRKTRIVCALPVGHPLCETPEITPDDLHGLPFIALIKNNIGRDLLDRALAKSGAEPRRVAEVSDLESALTFVEAGLGLSLVSAFPLPNSSTVCYRPFLPEIQSEIVCFSRKAADGDTQRYIDFLRARQPESDAFSAPL